MSVSLSPRSKALELFRKLVLIPLPAAKRSPATVLRGELNSAVLLVGPPITSADEAQGSAFSGGAARALHQMLLEQNGPDTGKFLCIACNAFGLKPSAESTMPIRQFASALDQTGQLKLIILVGKEAFKAIINSGKLPPQSMTEGRRLSIPPFRTEILTLPSPDALWFPPAEDEFTHRRLARAQQSAARLYARVLQPHVPLLNSLC